MGGNPYFYFTPYEADIDAALRKLREREFQAGRYDPALRAADPPTYTFQQSFPPGPSFPSPGAQHDSIEEAFEAGMESADGTGSIVDIQGISSGPAFFHASPLSGADLKFIFGSASPTRQDVEIVISLKGPGQMSEDNWARTRAFWDEIERGQGRYVIVYAKGAPTEIFFAGMSVD